MTVKIDEKIVGYEVVQPGMDERGAPLKITETATVVPYERPAILHGSTYKITPPTMNSALYITINDTELPEGARRPFEVFLNSKDNESAEWRQALTRMLSFILRQPTIPVYLAAEELKQVVDPNNSYFLTKNDPAGRGKVGGVVAHIGRVLYQHCEALGLTPKLEISAHTKNILAEKKAAAESKGIKGQECPKCHEMTLFVLDGCLTCVSCGNSKCG